MRVDWMILANYAESPPGGGTVHMIGGAWDTINVPGPFNPPPEAPPALSKAVAVMQGTLVVRVLFHQTEVGKNRNLRVVVVDEDGGNVGQLEGSFRAEQAPGLPPSWEQGVNMVFHLSGMPLPSFGLYRISLLVDDQHLGDREFRVLKLY